MSLEYFYYAMSAFNILIILFSYFVMKLISKWLRKDYEDEVITNKFHLFFIKYKGDLICYILMLFGLIKVNLEIVYITVSNMNLSSLDKFATIDMLFVTNVIAIIACIQLNLEIIKRHTTGIKRKRLEVKLT